MASGGFHPSYILAQTLAANGDWKPAAEEFERAAKEGSGAAQHDLGVLCQEGKGVPQSDVLAAFWWRKAAEQGVAASQANLGLCYAEGLGLPQNSLEAVKWFRLAADQQFPDGMYKLGVMYMQGNGVRKDLQEGYEWIKQAADAGHELAKRAAPALARAAVLNEAETARQNETGGSSPSLLERKIELPYGASAATVRASVSTPADPDSPGEEPATSRQGCNPYLFGIAGAIAIYGGREIGSVTGYMGAKDTVGKSQAVSPGSTPALDAIAASRNAMQGSGVAAMLVAWLILGGMSPKTPWYVKLFVSVGMGLVGAALVGYLSGRGTI